MTDFFESEQVRDDLENIQTCYNDLLKMSQNLKDFNPQERLEHIEKTMELIAMQKVFYARLSLVAGHVETDGQDHQDVQQLKDRIDTLSSIYSGGNGINIILDQMEQKLQQWRKEILDNA